VNQMGEVEKRVDPVVSVSLHAILSGLWPMEGMMFYIYPSNSLHPNPLHPKRFCASESNVYSFNDHLETNYLKQQS
jgi:hypothetical protein